MLLLAATFAIALLRVPAAAPAATQASPQTAISTATTTLTPAASSAIPAGVAIPLVNTRPVWAATAKIGDPLYLQTPAAALDGTRVVVPGGTYVLAQIVDLLKPTATASQALFTVSFKEMVLPNGTTLPFPANTFAQLRVSVTAANDLLLDEGTQFQMTTVAPMTLAADALRQAIALARPPALSSFHTATTCRYDPGTPGQIGSPGTPDVVIPGNPGTPDTIITNADGTTTTIPGIPATPSTTIAGTPSTPDIPGTPEHICPDPPKVIESLAETAPATLQANLPAPAPKKKKRRKS